MEIWSQTVIEIGLICQIIFLAWKPIYLVGWWQNQNLALKYVKNVLESKIFSASEVGVVCLSNIDYSIPRRSCFKMV